MKEGWKFGLEVIIPRGGSNLRAQVRTSRGFVSFTIGYCTRTLPNMKRRQSLAFEAVALNWPSVRSPYNASRYPESSALCDREPVCSWYLGV